MRSYVAFGIGLAIGIAGLTLYFQQPGGGSGSGAGAGTATQGAGGAGTTHSDNGSAGRKRDPAGGASNNANNTGTGQDNAQIDPRLRPFDTAVLTCVDRETSRPLAGVRVFDGKSDRPVGRSDAAGRVELKSVAPGFLFVFGDGYLAAPLDDATQLALANEGKATMLVWRDVYTMPVAIDPVWPEATGGSRPTSFAFVCAPAPGEHEREGIPIARLGSGVAVTQELRNTWIKHSFLVAQLPRDECDYHLGGQPLPHQVAAKGGRIRFADAIRYRLRALTKDGLVARSELRVLPRGEQRVELRFARGLRQALRIVDPSGAGVAGVQCVVSFVDVPQDPPRSLQSDNEGRVRLEGLVRGDKLELDLRALGFNPRKTQVVVDGKEQRVELGVRPVVRHRLRLVERGSQRAIAGAELFLGNPAKPSVRATSDKEGRATLPLQRGEERVLTVRKKGFVTYREVLALDRGVPLPDRIELLPSARDRQVELRVIAGVHGQVLIGGKPRMGVVVALLPWTDKDGKPTADAMQPAGFAKIADNDPNTGRMRLGGFAPKTQLEAQTDKDGRFELWSASAGRAALCVYGLKREYKREIFVRLGKRQKVEVRR